jgi:hypothetical protein
MAPILHHHSLTQIPNRIAIMHLVTSGTAGLGDDALELIDLGLGAAERTETLLCQLAGALVLAVAEEFDDAALVWGEAV